MIRILHIARYHNAMMERKIEYMAAQPDLTFWLVRPRRWQNEYGSIKVSASSPKSCHTLTMPLLGKPNDPHRALYRTMTFCMYKARPHIIHAEEEPDSLAALQIVCARSMFAPTSRLILHTWQNVNRSRRWYVRFVMRCTLFSADAVLCANREALTVLRLNGYERLKALVPPQGVDVQVFRPPVSRPQPHVFTVAYIGRFAPEKGLDTLLEAVRLCGPSIRLILVGDGPDKTELVNKAHVAQMNNRVEFRAPVAAERLPDVLVRTDVLVLPSRTTPVWKEQFGRVLIEAMACRVPVIGSDSGAIPEVIGDGGLIFPEGDAGALAERLRRLMESPAFCEQLAERGYDRVMRHYTQECVAEQTADFYRQVMG